MPADATLPSPEAVTAGAVETWRTRLAGWIPFEDPFALVGFAIYLVFILVAIFANQLATHDPTEIFFDANFNLAADLPPSRDFLLGTTTLGRDVWSQLVLGSRSALLVGLTAAVMVVGIGTLVGLVSGYFGGLIDSALMRLTDVAFGSHSCRSSSSCARSWSRAYGTSCSPWRWCCGATPHASSARRCLRCARAPSSRRPG